MIRSLVQRRPSPRVLTVARWVLGIAIVLVLLARFDMSAVVRQMAAVDLRLALPALAGLVLVHAVGAATWRYLAERLARQTLTWRSTMRTYYVAQGIGGLTPANLGSDAYRLYAVRGSGGWRRGLGPIVVQRVTSSGALAILGIVSLAWLPMANGGTVLVAGAVTALALGSSALVLLLRPRWGWRAGGEAGDPPAADAHTVAVAVGAGLAGGFAFHAASIALGLLMVTSVTPVAEPVKVLACLAVARLAILVPLSPSGLGVQEGLLSLLFVSIGLSPESALAAALLSRLAMVAMAVLSGLLLAVPGLPSRQHAASSRPGTPA
jgi:uncharacterized membrane protein YbhN (UPF0104 family)